jgi:hypothetical protein
MPSVPILTTPQVAPAVPASVPSFAPGPGAFGAGLGAGLVQAGNAMARAEDIERQRVNASAVMSAYADALSLRSEIMHGEQIGLARQSGEGYLAAVEPAMGEWEKRIDEIGAALTPEQQHLFAARIERLRGRFSEDIAAGQSRARIEKYDADKARVTRDVFRAALEGVEEGGVFVAEDGTVVDDTIMAAREALYGEGGALDAYAAIAAEKARVPLADAEAALTEEWNLALHGQTISELLSGGLTRAPDPMAARAYFKKWEREIPPEHRQGFEDDIVRGVTVQGASDAAAARFAKHHDPDADTTLAQQERSALAEEDDPQIRKAITSLFAAERQQRDRDAVDAYNKLRENIKTLPRDVSLDEVAARWPDLWKLAGPHHDALSDVWDTHNKGGDVVTQPKHFNYVMELYETGNPQFDRHDYSEFVDKGWLSVQDADFFTKLKAQNRAAGLAGTKGVMSSLETVKWYAERIAGEDKGDTFDKVFMDLNRFILSKQGDAEFTSGQVDAALQPLLLNKLEDVGSGGMFNWFDAPGPVGAVLRDMESDYSGAEILAAYESLRGQFDALSVTRDHPVSKSALMTEIERLRDIRGIR